MNPYYRMLELMAAGENRPVFAVLQADLTFQVEGRTAAAAGKAQGLTYGPQDAGGRYLCLDTGGGLYVLCRLEDC